MLVVTVFFKIIVNVDRKEAVGFLFDHAGNLPHD